MVPDHFRLRPSRVLALAQRDWRRELKGPQGAWLPIVMAALLVPSSTAPLPRGLAQNQAIAMTVEGDVPAEVLDLEFIQPATGRANLTFRQHDGVLYTRGEDPIPEVRAILDRDDGTEVRVERFSPGYLFPGRSLLFALISASTLTGAISASLGGERSNQSLVTLMAAAISRLEIVLGKLTAWGGLGALTALGAALLAIALGRIDGGYWLLPLPFVPIATAAFGLWLVRRASDVVAASTTLIRVLPVLLVTTGLVAWIFGNSHPLLGAMVPIGGALLAAGDTWAGITAPLLATASALALTTFCVVGTARELESPSSGAPILQQVLGLGALVASTWWIPVVTPLLWGEAGNFKVTQQIPIETGIWAGILSFVMFVVVSMGRSAEPFEGVGLVLPTRRDLGVGALGAPVVLAVLLGVVGQFPLDLGGFLGRAAERMMVAAFPVDPFGMAVALIVAEEVLFRGWLARRVTPLGAAFVYVTVKAPLDPLGGVAMAAVLGVIGARGGPFATIVARLIALLALALLGT